MIPTSNSTFSDLSPSHQATLATTVHSLNFFVALVHSIVEYEEIPAFLKDVSVPDLMNISIEYIERDQQAGKIPPAQTLCKKMDKTLADGIANAKQGAHVEFVRMATPNNN